MTTATTVAPAGGHTRLWLRLAGAALLLATGAIHLDLYVTGYDTIPTIGPLFLLQIIAAFALGLAVALTGSRLVALAGALFGLATLGGYLLSLWVGLFGFREVRTTAGIAAGVIEVATFAVLGALAVLPADGTAGLADRIDGKTSASLGRLAERAPGGLRGAEGAVGAISLIALVVLLVSAGTASGANAPAASGGGKTLKTTVIKGQTVLTNAKGFTLYTFAPDPRGKSVCNGGCAAYWPPVSGPVSAPGISGTFSVITRSDGSKQEAWNGHPLYAYIGDSKPGQASGNNVNLNGGIWHEVVVSTK
ncbi:MAG TPA: hypothetical protein VFQ44_23175 [Streptosporangiaceae bacterium]|nr:hypothetical protein [Streptosporangiaceae bacterium]